MNRVMTGEWTAVLFVSVMLFVGAATSSAGDRIRIAVSPGEDVRADVIPLSPIAMSRLHAPVDGLAIENADVSRVVRRFLPMGSSGGVAVLVTKDAE